MDGGVEKRKTLLFVSSTPQSACADSSPAGEPFGALYKLPHKTNKGTHCVPSFLQSLMLIRRQADFAARVSAYGFAVFAAAAGIMVPSALTYTLSTLAPERVIR